MTTHLRRCSSYLILLFIVFFFAVGIGVPKSHGDETRSWFEISPTRVQSDWGVIPSPHRSANTPGAQPRLYEHGYPTNLEQLALEQINAYRANPKVAARYYGIALNQGLASGTISSAPKPPLAFNPQLIDAARGHSLWMLNTQSFSHTGKKDTTPKDRIADAGYVFPGTWSCAENIGWSGTTGPLSTEFHLRAVLKGLFLSSGHRVNTLSENSEEVGIGVFSGNMLDFNSVMVTENYASNSSRAKPLLLGVVYKDTNRNAKYDLGEGVEGVSLFLNNGDYFVVSSASGGFAIPLQGLKGQAILVATGKDLPGFVVKRVMLKDQNIKIDLDISRF